MENEWKVVVADRFGITRRAVATVIRNAAPGNEVLECGTAEAAMACLEQGSVTLLVVDLEFPGLEFVAAAREQFPGLKIVVMAGYDRPEDALRALQAGADGFLVKGMFPEELLTCLRCVVETGVIVTSRLVKRALQNERVLEESRPVHGEYAVDGRAEELLTPREREIFSLMAQACSNKEIAATLHIAEQTVKAHVSRILVKLGQPNRAQAVIHGLRNGRESGGNGRLRQA